MLPVPTIPDLADYSGRPQASYPAFAASALKQATFLMSIRTCLVSMPVNPDDAQLITYGILELADDIVLKQPYQEINAKPFSSETIMSYSYSKAAQKARKGEETGLMWFDLAVQRLSVCEADQGGHVASSSISIFEKDGVTVDGAGRPQVLGPEGLYEPQVGWYSTNSINEVK